MLGVHNGACGYACLIIAAIACHTAISIICHKKMSNLVKCGLELKMNWLNWSILISSGFQFQFNSNSKSFNSIPIQFMLNWIELIINSNSIHELIRALATTEAGYQSDAESTKDSPYLALMGELWGVFCEYFGENWPRNNGTALYIGPCCNGILLYWPATSVPVHSVKLIEKYTTFWQLRQELFDA